MGIVISKFHSALKRIRRNQLIETNVYDDTHVGSTYLVISPSHTQTQSWRRLWRSQANYSVVFPFPFPLEPNAKNATYSSWYSDLKGTCFQKDFPDTMDCW